jgi:hypothetical protein
MLPFAIAEQTQIQVGRQPAAFGDLQPGQTVRILYEVQDGRRVALGIAAHGIAKKPVAPSGEAVVDPNGIRGALVRVAVSDREIVVMVGVGGSEKEMTFQVAEPCKITKDGKPMAFDALKEGERVAVTVEKREGKDWAVAIQVGDKAAGSALAGHSRVEKLRQILKMADAFLEQLENQGGKNGP